MTDCNQIDSLITPYVDDDISPATRDVVDRHLRDCRVCRGRVHAEQAVQALIRARRPALKAGVSPPLLRVRCASLSSQAASSAVWRVRLLPFALAASLVVIVAGAFLFELTEWSTRVLAAELTADHLKCFRVLNNVLNTRQTSGAVEASMASGFDWPMRLPEHAERIGLELVGARPCLYAEGLVAHIMYRHNGSPVSLFMLPRGTRAEEAVEVMGHQTKIWSVGGRTFVLIASEPRAEVERITAFVQAALR